MNKRGEKPLALKEDTEAAAPTGPIDLATQENINRFDRTKKKKRKKKPVNKDNDPQPAQNS
jgi:hypothetical protein